MKVSNIYREASYLREMKHTIAASRRFPHELPAGANLAFLSSLWGRVREFQHRQMETELQAL